MSLLISQQKVNIILKQNNIFCTVVSGLKLKLCRIAMYSNIFRGVLWHVSRVGKNFDTGISLRLFQSSSHITCFVSWSVNQTFTCDLMTSFTLIWPSWVTRHWIPSYCLTVVWLLVLCSNLACSQDTHTPRRCAWNQTIAHKGC